jgi:hypothetical protein
MGIFGQSRRVRVNIERSGLSGDFFPSLDKEGWREAPGWFDPVNHSAAQAIKGKRIKNKLL